MSLNFRHLWLNGYAFSDSLSLFMLSTMIRYVRNIIIEENTKVLIYIYIYIHIHSHTLADTTIFQMRRFVRGKKNIHTFTFQGLIGDILSRSPCLEASTVIHYKTKQTNETEVTTRSLHFYVSVFEIQIQSLNEKKELSSF